MTSSRLTTRTFATKREKGIKIAHLNRVKKAFVKDNEENSNDLSSNSAGSKEVSAKKALNSAGSSLTSKETTHFRTSGPTTRQTTKGRAEIISNSSPEIIEDISRSPDEVNDRNARLHSEGDSDDEVEAVVRPLFPCEEESLFQETVDPQNNDEGESSEEEQSESDTESEVTFRTQPANSANETAPLPPNEPWPPTPAFCT